MYTSTALLVSACAMIIELGSTIIFEPTIISIADPIGNGVSIPDISTLSIVIWNVCGAVASLFAARQPIMEIVLDGPTWCKMAPVVLAVHVALLKL